MAAREEQGNFFTLSTVTLYKNDVRRRGGFHRLVSVTGAISLFLFFSIYSEEKVLVKSFTPNPHLDGMISDHLYHLALGTSTHNLREMFGDVKFICVGGTAKRMLAFACEVKDYLGIKLPTGVRLQNMTQDADRYSMYKVGSVLSVTHGMGISSLSILLHELIKLIKYAGCSDVTFLRIGTSGGLGLDPGTVVITEKAVDGLMRSYYEVAILGKIVKCPATFNLDVVDKLVDIGSKTFDHFKTVKGTTMCTSDFYEGQGRIDGAFCSFTEEDKLQFLRKVNSKGVVNIEMECVPFAAMCQSAGVKGAIICVTLLNRLHGDQITISPEQYSCFQRRPQLVAAEFIKQQLAQQ